MVFNSLLTIANDLIDSLSLKQLVSNPHQFDVMLMTNLYGSIVSNVICGLMGGAGLLSGRNYGTEVTYLFIYIDNKCICLKLIICSFNYDLYPSTQFLSPALEIRELQLLGRILPTQSP